MVTRNDLAPGVKFTVKTNNPLINRKTFTIMEGYITTGLFDQMNIEKMGSKKITLYTYNMMGIRSIATIKYSDMELVTE